jgi:transcriptional regulator with XRE-family HTH domain
MTFSIVYMIINLEVLMELGKTIYRLRKEKGFTQESFAEALGVSRQAVSKFARAAVGTLVFGALGTVAGLVSGATSRPKAKISVALQIDDIDVF